MQAGDGRGLIVRSLEHPLKTRLARRRVLQGSVLLDRTRTGVPHFAPDGRFPKTTPTATPVSIDPCVVASFHETVFEGSEVEGALGRRCRYTKGRGRKHLLGVDARHKALAQKA